MLLAFRFPQSSCLKPENKKSCTSQDDKLWKAEFKTQKNEDFLMLVYFRLNTASIQRQ